MLGFFDAIARWGESETLRAHAQAVLDGQSDAATAVYSMLEHGPFIVCVTEDSDGPRWWAYLPNDGYRGRLALTLIPYSYPSREMLCDRGLAGVPQGMQMLAN